MTQIITRFAPSPTGYIHIGNARTAIINWLYAKKHQGKFILRLDDTDVARSKDEFKSAIFRDIAWLGLEYDLTFAQSERIGRYEEIKQDLIRSGRIYPCFESEEELQLKRKSCLASGRPPIYDRAALKLSATDIEQYIASGKKPHYRFFINDADILWNDLIKSAVKYEGRHLSDPVVIREDGTMTYMLCSVIDDVDYNITHIIRGEDHVTNTAIQVQMFEALGSKPPEFGHLSLVKAQDDKISKRVGGFEIEALKSKLGLEAMTIINFLTFIGSSKQLQHFTNVKDLINEFDITSYSKSPTIYQPEELERINHKILLGLDFNEVKQDIINMGLEDVTENFWLAVRPNLLKLKDLHDWWKIFHQIEKNPRLDNEFLSIAAKLLPSGEITHNTWSEWTRIISSSTGKKGKDLYLPLRLALTGMEQGPELQNILPIIGRDQILARLSS